MLSIIPEKISPTLKFLHPYVQSLANPRRHAIVYAASINRPFLTAMSAYVLKSCRLGLQHPTLLSFWASIVTEAVAAILDQSRSARLEAQQRHQEDTVISLLSILNDGLSLDNASDLRVGCYMVLTVLASKASLDDNVLSVMMEAVTYEWCQTSHAGLICLSVLAEEKRTVGLPTKAFEAVIALEHLDDDLKIISRLYKTDKLVLGVALGVVSGLGKVQDHSGSRLLKVLMEANIMSDASTKVIVGSVISALEGTAPDIGLGLDVQGLMSDLVRRLRDTEDLNAVVDSTIKESNFDLGHMESRPRQGNYERSTSEQHIEYVNMKDADEQMTTNDFDTLASRIPTRTAFEISFLSHSHSYVYGSLAHTFLSIHTSAVDVERFSDLPVLRKSLGMTEPLFLSFFVRIWCGLGPEKSRAIAIRTVIDYFRVEKLAADVQMLFPYILYALSDTSPIVRRSAANLVLVLAPAYARMAEMDNKEANQPILGQQQIYGQGRETQAVAWLSNKEAASIILDLIVPGLEECMLDESRVSQILSDNINGPKHTKDINAKALKKSLRLALLSSVCSHVVNTPLYAVKSRLLEMLNQIPKVGSTSRTKFLLPLLLNTMEQDEQEYERVCREEQLDQSQLVHRIASIVIPGDREGIQTLKSIIEPLNNPNFPTLRGAALHRLQSIWTSIKPDLQFLLATTLFESAIAEVEAGVRGNQKAEAMETLRTLPLSTAIQKSFLENLPSISSTLQDKLPVSKRRRTNHGHLNGHGASNERSMVSAIRQITFVLELIGDAKIERHPELLGGLFRIMSDLQHFQGRAVTAIDYLRLLAIEAMLPIVKRVEVRNQ